MDSGDDEGRYTFGDYADEQGAVSRSRANSRADPLSVLDEPDPIFANEDLLRIDHIPSKNKIVGRNREIQTVARRLKPAIRGGSGKGTLLLGKSGSGKTLVTKYVSQAVKDRGENEDTRIGVAIIDCGQRRSETQTVIQLAKSLNQRAETGIDVPSSGISTGAYYDRLWEIIDDRYDSVIVVLDEIDRLAPEERSEPSVEPQHADDSKLLMQLSRAGEEDDIDAGLTVMGISNDLKYGDRLDTRVESSFAPDEVVFPAYDATQLREILEHRDDAFRDDVLQSDVIPLVAALSAREHGDARRGINLFRLAGEVAREEGAETVTKDHVRTADVDADVTRIKDLLHGTPTHAKIAIGALAAMDELTDVEFFPSQLMYEMYRYFAGTIGIDPLGHKRILDQLREYDTLQILDMRRTSEGFAQGTPLKISLLDDSDLVLQSIGLDDRCKDIPLDSETKRTLVQRVEREA